jgi:hypothetical protein
MCTEAQQSISASMTQNCLLEAVPLADFIDWMNRNKWVKYSGIDRWCCHDGKYWRGLRPKTTAELLDLYQSGIAF